MEHGLNTDLKTDGVSPCLIRVPSVANLFVHFQRCHTL